MIFFGRNSLIFYLVHIQCYKFLIPVAATLFNLGLPSFLQLMIESTIIVLTIIISSLVALLINKTKLKVIIGKF